MFTVLSYSSAHWSSRLSRKKKKRENENSYGTVIVSAVSIAICFEDQENILYSLVCLPSLPFICCQVLVSWVSCDDSRSANFQTTHSPSAPNRFPLTLEATGILEFPLAGVDLPVVLACAVLFTGMPVLPTTGIDDRGFPNIFDHFFSPEYTL